MAKKLEEKELTVTKLIAKKSKPKQLTAKKKSKKNNKGQRNLKPQA